MNRFNSYQLPAIVTGKMLGGFDAGKNGMTYLNS
jgi:hypothetical protein